jgi:uncharacterized membrane protein YfcA
VDWTVYWFMLPVCIVVASVAMFSGISGAALLTPVFLIGFPLVGVPRLTAVQAIGSALFLETFGFGSGVVGYARRRHPDYRLLTKLVLVTVPLGIVGALLARDAPATTLKAIYGGVMFVVAAILIAEARTRRDRSHDHVGADDSGWDAARLTSGDDARASSRRGDWRSWREYQWESGDIRYIRARDGTVYSYRPRGEAGTRALTGIGAFFAGLISTGVGEATAPNLIRRVKMPVAVAAATSTLVVASTVVGAALTHLVQLTIEGGLSAIPWNLVVWAVPGAIIGAQIGTRLQGRIDERKTNYFFGVLFTLIGAAFFLSFTLFSETFRTG